MKLRITVLLMLWGITGWQAASATATPPAGPHLVVVGYSRVAVEPDQAQLQLQITITTQTVQSAKQQIDRQVNRYLDFLQQQGIHKTEIDAIRLHSQRITQPDQSTVRSPAVRYQLNRQITVTVRPLTKLNRLLEEAFRCGFQELQPVRFGVADERPYRLRAREQATQDAVAQAEHLAAQLQSQRGSVYSISYQRREHFPRFSANTYLLDAPHTDDQDQSYLPQTLYFTDQVEVIFRLKSEQSAERGPRGKSL